MPLPDEESQQKHLDTFTHGLSLRCTPNVDVSPSTASAAHDPGVGPGPLLPTVHRVTFGEEERFLCQEDQAIVAGPDEHFAGSQQMLEEELWPGTERTMGDSWRSGPFSHTSPLSPSVCPHTQPSPSETANPQINLQSALRVTKVFLF